MSSRKLGFAVLVLLSSVSLFAQRRPRDGACFYREENFRGRNFCVGIGQNIDHLEQGFDDGIYSVQLFGRVEAIVFNDRGFAGVATRIDNSIPNLRGLRVPDDPSKNWAGRISSVQVNFRRDSFRPGRPPQWGHGQQPRSGACFYRGGGFQGDYFCMSTGESYDFLPPGFNDSISSIRIFGGAAVAAYNDRGFGGIRINLDRDIPDLGRFRTQDNPYKNWGDRISSVQVLGRGWGQGGWRPGRPY